MNRIKLLALLVVLGIGTFVAMSSIYTVSEVQQAIITQFGEPVGAAITTAGLKARVPFIQDVNLIDKRVLEWGGTPTDMPTKDKLVDPLQYFLRLRDERSAQSRLDDILGSETRNAVAKHELIEIIRTTKDRVPLRDTALARAGPEQDVGSLVPIEKGRKVVEQQIFTAAAEKVRVFGIELLDIRFKRINYNESVRPKIYDRMISERRQIAERYLSEGNGEAARIRGDRPRPTGRSRRSVASPTRKPPKSIPRPTTRARRRWNSMNSHEPCSPTNPSLAQTPLLSFPRVVTSSSFWRE
jgi:modulator of FtsH protease HflC